MTVTETNAFPFTPLDEPEAAEGTDRRVVLLAGGVVAALALAGAGYVFLGGSDDVEDTAFTPVTRAAQPATTTRKAVAATKKIATPKVPVPFEEALGRNPFKPLYVVPAAAPAAAAGATDPTLPQGTTSTTVAVGSGSGTASGTTPATTGGTTSTTSGSTTTTSGTAAQPAAAPAAPTAREYALVLRRVYGAGKDLTAEYTIDGRKQLAKVGVRFGPTSEIRLISLQQGPKAGQWTSVLQVGDGEPFDAVTGDKVSVR